MVGCLYLPNGNPAPGPKFDYRFRWFNRLIAHAAELLSTNLPVILAGDYNVMPMELDVYKPERWVDDALFRPEVRAAFQQLLGQAGRMPFDTFTRKRRSIRSGNMSGMPTVAMQASASIISCSAPP
jgi:exonuclease III